MPVACHGKPELAWKARQAASSRAAEEESPAPRGTSGQTPSKPDACAVLGERQATPLRYSCQPSACSSAPSEKLASCSMSTA